ncbi:flagellar biosynthetic protein FliR [Paenibacillus koleovorans]|uniref:flagellar biosynthetic protein FliR n=1 Tax=Paenibacillus koleovorans TaxID=121608 RepID=UPI000FD947F5|nr:flagellar biosynthetic protein FliR [Paenibacillus koleovorans]
MQELIPYLPNFLLIFCRITAFFVSAPIFSTRGVPPTFKIGLAFFVSFILLASSEMEKPPITMDSDYILAILKETLIGLLLGFIAYIFFNAVQIAGSFIDIQMGLGIANVIDPMSGVSSPIMGNFKFIIAILLFLSINGHHYMIAALVRSYEIVPLGQGIFEAIATGAPNDHMIRSFASMFALALQLSAPLVVCLFMTDVGLGILSKTAPQFNIFVVGVPIKIMVGFLLLLLVIPGMLFLFQDLFQSMFEAMEQMMNLLRASPSAS